MDKKFWLLFLLAAVLLALIVSPFVSSWPDGLERVAGNKGFIGKGEVKPAVRSPIPYYLMPGIKNEKVAVAIAGVVGTFLVFGVGCGLASLLGRSKRHKKDNAPPFS
jgi:cobalt/nickel transport protein